MIKTLSSNAINIYIFPDVNSTSVRAYMEATFMLRLTPLCAKDDDRAPVRRAIWKPTPKIFGVTYIKCSLAQNPNNPEMAQFNADMNVLCRHLNVLRSHFGAQAAEEGGQDKELYSCPTENSGNTGRPRYLISVQQLQFLRDLHFSWTKIAKILGVSRKTINRRRQELGMSEELSWSSVSDDDLKQIMYEIQTLTPKLDYQKCP